MTHIMDFQHGSRLSWNRDFLRLNDKTGKVSSVKLNLLQRILRITLGSLAYSLGINAFYATTIFSQKRIIPFERTRNAAVAAKIEMLVRTLNCCGKKIFFKAPHFSHFDHPGEKIKAADNQLAEKDAKTQANAKLRNFFPTPIPKDMAVLLLNWLDFKDIARMRQVNQSWHQLIADITSSLSKRFADSCYAEITELLINAPTKDHDVILKGFKYLLKSLVKYDIEATMKTVRIAKQKASKYDKDFENYLFREIAKAEAEYDLESAKQTMAKITNDYLRYDAIIHITLFIEKNIPRAKELALAQGSLSGDYSLLKIIKLEAETDIPGALITLGYIKSRLDVPDLAKIEIIKRLARTDMPAAKKLAAELYNPCFRYEAELALAQHDPEPNFQPAIASALMINDCATFWTEDERRQQKALAHIAVIQNKFDKNGAQKTVALMTNNAFQQKWALNEFDRQEAQSNFSIAMQCVVLTGQDYRFQLNLLKHMAKKNIWEAKTFANSFEDLEERIFALLELAKFVRKKALSWSKKSPQ